MNELYIVIATAVASFFFVIRQKIFEMKAKAYADFLEQFEEFVPEKDDVIQENNKEIRKMNKALVVLTTYAPDCVVKRINEIAKQYGKMNRDIIAEVRAILHNDLHHPWCSSMGLKKSDFPYFIFR